MAEGLSDNINKASWLRLVPAIEQDAEPDPYGTALAYLNDFEFACTTPRPNLITPADIYGAMTENCSNEEALAVVTVFSESDVASARAVAAIFAGKCLVGQPMSSTWDLIAGPIARLSRDISPAVAAKAWEARQSYIRAAGRNELEIFRRRKAVLGLRYL